MIDKPTQKAIRDGYIVLPMELRTEYVHKMADKYRVPRYTIRLIVDGVEPEGWCAMKINGTNIWNTYRL